MLPFEQTIFECRTAGTDRLFPAHEVSGSYSGIFKDAVDYISGTDLYRTDLWEKFVSVFRQKPDSHNLGWRGEYWGKMMRGACWVYSCTYDQNLYHVLRESVTDLLQTQEPDGTVSSYSSDTQFDGWDLWSRKYVLLGLQYFIEICPDEILNRKILDSMKRQLDAIMARIGTDSGKRPITQASRNWGGVNSCSILEPVVRLYNATQEQKYLNFAHYIVSTGGCEGGDLVELALKDEIAPWQYPEVKAYETMSFFEGIIEYYRVTGEERYRRAAINFGKQVIKTDLTVLGCSGCTHELFDHSSLRQTDTEYQGVMQETCVSVTWMKLCLQLLRLSGDPVFADCIEQSFYNLYLGSFNTHRNPAGSEKRGVTPAPDALPVPQILPFDSYSPLTAGVRGKKVGGYQLFSDHTFYGCCACIGAAGVGTLYQGAILHSRNGLSVQFYIPGTMSLTTPGGQKIIFHTETSYPLDGNIRIRIGMEQDERFPVSFRIPEWSRQTELICNGEKQTVTSGYFNVDRMWKNGDCLEIGLDMRVQAILPPSGAVNEQYFISFRYGALMLGADARLGRSPSEAVHITIDDSGYVKNARRADCPEIPDSRLCLALPETDGNTLRLINYFSAGKTWDQTSECAVWLRR